MTSISPITLISRDECFRENPVLAHAVAGWQQAHAEGDDDAAEWWAEAHDPIEPDPAIRWAESMTLYLPGRGIAETGRELGPALARVLMPFEERTITLIHSFRTGGWVTGRRGGPPELMEADRSFRVIGAGKMFTGAIRVAADDAAAVLVPLLWMVRLDAGYGEVFIGAGDAPVVASLCKYANLHVDVYSADAVAAIREAARDAGFAEVPDGICRERIGEGGAIPGRALRV
jgi:hypothetical protein